ncbi:cobalamin biosynthesis protein [Clostridium sp. NSJ-6]|uniref:Cobalamin biosynthesis protein CobD n=1 Tax=Clostridium hominis TaxID=2763036 RepID=A0ABR7D9A8_9CLOT|nr:adenosylcobinamide-phosphate synthase CbiB [Clostridium hominis]MBC5627323.1 cobalamin biosynthesis protein [Clostridium hominis]MDU2672376.1 adenosylcobinamide-phosphate synthase CbiB [Clostridium sp.]
MIEFLLLNLISIGIAIVVDFIIGDPYGFPHPVIYMGKFISTLEKYFRKKSKNDKELKKYGGFIFLILILTTYITTFVIVSIFSFNKILYILVNSFLLYTTVAAKCLKVESEKVYKALEDEDINKARLMLSYIVGRDTTTLEESEIVRAAVETVAENASDGVIAPLFYGIIGGAPLAMMYKAINTMDSMLGYLTEKYKYIGYFPAKLDDIANFIPARITGIAMCISSPIVGGNIIRAVRVMIRDRKNHKSPNCAYPEGAAAGAMDIRLGGTNIYFGEVIEKPTIGDNIKPINRMHIKECNKLMIVSEILFFLFSIFTLGVINL